MDGMDGTNIRFGKANNVFKLIRENSTFGGIIKCCGVWLARDCWLHYANERCLHEHIGDVHRLPFKLLPKLDKWCTIYHDQTFVCRLPHYLTPIGYGLMGLILTIISLWLTIRLIQSVKRWNDKKWKQRKETIDIETANEHETINDVIDNLLIDQK
ncbi:hypothetical protein RDWZM_005144 [Blomia tropicalis]|uniref:Uncharacterized protein n=1 Tax=Blomia tropicalis TaxID=40697 RepID=A0A9Q0M838_BLOTA|nr:hypothetical protein RDWZM_005144 [Blomia tropicalis]